MKNTSGTRATRPHKQQTHIAHRLKITHSSNKTAKLQKLADGVGSPEPQPQKFSTGVFLRCFS